MKVFQKYKNFQTVHVYVCVCCIIWVWVPEYDHVLACFSTGSRPEDGVRDMIVISDIDENGINTNLQVRYKQDIIYVSFCGQGNMTRWWA